MCDIMMNLEIYLLMLKKQSQMIGVFIQNPIDYYFHFHCNFLSKYDRNIFLVHFIVVHFKIVTVDEVHSNRDHVKIKGRQQ